jgi:C4-dicarboxylate-specific signal transduction histidine kinase
VIPAKSSNKLTVRLVQGMLVQILENLISNSVYWLKLQKIIEHKFEPRIDIVINTQTKQLIFSDNGPGIEWNRREEVFEPFVTTKPPGEGKGLGLYIAREIAKYHGISLSLLYENNDETRKSSAFVINFDGIEQ